MRRPTGGFSLIEAIVAVAILAFVGISAFQLFNKLADIVRGSQAKLTATALANEQLEIIRNLPFADVGIVGGIPVGKIPRTQTLTRGAHTFSVVTTIRNVDDPFDGTIGGSPNDLSPADYKLAEVAVTCTTCARRAAVTFTTTAAPKNLETASTNGALFVRVFDANGFAISNASVHIENNSEIPPVVIDELTNANGELQLVDVPPGNEVYEITVAKQGYSTDQTYPSGAPQNPNPTKPHASVVLQDVTQVSFSIDRLSTLAVSTVSETCVPVGDVDFHLQGAKLLGTNPDVPKYSQDLTTSGAGTLTLSSMEWDTYGLTFTDSAYDLSGSMPLAPLGLTPNTTQNLQLTTRTKNPRSLLVAVKDSATQLPVTDASVRLEKESYGQTLITGRGFLSQTDWSGGGGQESLADPTKYWSSSGVDTTTEGEIRLASTLGTYEASGELVSSTFDTGSSSNFYNILWQPQTQPPETGPDAIRFQFASNNDNATWNFLGPDGTPNTYYTLADTTLNAVHNGNRYFRYRAVLQTADTTVSPIISDIAATFTSSCTPAGQVFFDNLTPGSYTLTVSKTGYQPFTDTVEVTDAWQERDLLLIPE